MNLEPLTWFAYRVFAGLVKLLPRNFFSKTVFMSVQWKAHEATRRIIYCYRPLIGLL